MKLNQKKSCAIVFHFTQNYQLTSRFTMEGKPLDIVDHTKLFGLKVSSDLTWSRNTQYIIIYQPSNFNDPTIDLV